MRNAQKVIVFVWAFPILFLLLFSRAAVSADQDSWEGIERIVAVGDVHGDYQQFVAVLRSAQLIDSKEGWSGGKTHLVQTGDVLDRGPDARKVMAKNFPAERMAQAGKNRDKTWWQFWR